MFVDVQKLHGLSGGACTFDNGFGSTASCVSAITYIDGSAGKLYYRGYGIEELAEKANFEEVIFLLLDGELPTATEKAEFVAQLKAHSMVNEQLITLELPARRASDVNHVLRRGCAVELLPHHRHALARSAGAGHAAVDR